VKRKKNKRRSIHDTQQTDYSGVYLQNEKLELKLQRLIDKLYRDRKVSTLQLDSDIFELTKEIDGLKVMIESSNKLKIFKRPFTTPSTFRIPVPSVSDVKRDPKTYPSSWYTSAYVPSDTEINRIKRTRHQRPSLTFRRNTKSKRNNENNDDNEQVENSGTQMTSRKESHVSNGYKWNQSNMSPRNASTNFRKIERRHSTSDEPPPVFSNGFSKSFASDYYEETLLRPPEYVSKNFTSNSFSDASSTYSESPLLSPRENNMSMLQHHEHSNSFGNAISKTAFSYGLPTIQTSKPHDFSLVVRPPTQESKRLAFHPDVVNGATPGEPVFIRRKVSVDVAKRSPLNDFRRGDTEVSLKITQQQMESDKKSRPETLKPPNWKNFADKLRDSQLSDASYDDSDTEGITSTRSLRKLKEMASLDTIANQAPDKQEIRKKRLLEQNKRKLDRIDQKIRKFVDDLKIQKTREQQEAREKERERKRRRHRLALF